MSSPKSLAQRLIKGIVIAQAVTLTVWVLIVMVVSPYISYEELAAFSAKQVVASAVEMRDGALVVAQTGDLAEYVQRRPGFAFAVLVAGSPIEGSSPELAGRWATSAAPLPISGQFRFADGLIGYAQQLPWRQSTVTVVTVGNQFRIDDLPVFFQIYLPQFLLMFAPAFLAGAIATQMVVVRALRPLRAASAQAAAVQLSSLTSRLERDSTLPSEIVPLIDAINELLERLDGEIGKQRLFAANAAHELRTPVAVLGARVESLPDGPERIALRRDVMQLSTLVDQLLAAARLENDPAQVNLPVDLVHTTRQVIADMAPLALRDGRNLSFRTRPSAALVLGDCDAIASMVRNVLDNALRVEPVGGTVAVQVTQGEDHFAILVHDHGPGISSEDQAHMFDAFWRKRQDSGAGLGLQISRQIAMAHGGTITCDSRMGAGSTFRISLPFPPAGMS
ncbi:sensor histidine kinase [Devosia sediminis]|uniref:histidine kinase n=1 Tax=Devosia sediminis TaxID=2798801 RepID=A0A934ML25_9HYPH|nr:HAMP domain-containing sensor histidine kinase [Devosia sediminis]MBJ3784710.1 HAMP domain-containing histidine kinase [Devosia sediminis]